MSSAELKSFINKAQSSGMSDIKIFLSVMDNPKFKKGVEKGNAQGLSNRQIAAGLGLNIPEHKAVDPMVEAKKQQAKGAGATKAWESGLLGFSDLGAGVVQGFTYAADGINKGINKVAGTNLDTNAYERFTKERKDIDDFHKMRREANGQGFDGWRLGGQVSSMPLPIGRTYQGAKVLSGAGAKIAGENALVGAGLSGASFAENANERLANTALGGVGGALGGAVGEKLGQGINKLTQGGKRLHASVSTEQTNKILQSIDQKLDEALQQSGMSLGEISEDAVRGMRADALKAIRAGGSLSPTAVARKVVLDRLGLKGTRAQISGDAKQWQQEAELAKIDGAGDPLREKFIEDNRALTDLLDSEISATGGKSLNHYDAGREAGETLLDQYAQNKKFVSQAYDFANNASGGDIPINGRGLANDVFTELDNQALASFLPPDIAKKLTQISEKPELFTLKKGEELIKILNDHRKSSLNMGEPTATTRAIDTVRQALNGRQDEALQELSQSGNDAARAFQFARQAHRANKSIQAKLPMLQDMLKQQSKGSLNFDDLYKKHVLTGKVNELKQTMEILENTNPQAIADIQHELLKDLSEKALNSNGQFSPAGMKRFLDAVGDQRLNILFSQKQVNQLKDIFRASKFLITQPPHSYVNNSNSSAGLINHFIDLLKLPGVRKITPPVMDVINSKATSNALKGGSIANTGKATVTQTEQSLIDRLTKAGVITGANLPNQ